jgi:hypothetical protein
MKTSWLFPLLIAPGLALSQAPKAAPPVPAPVVVPAPPAFQPPASTATNFWAGQLRAAKRIVVGRTMDITPLVRWQMNSPNSDRPLKAWVFVAGKLTAPTASGWQVTGAVDGQQQPRPFLVRNPPVEAQAEFNRLKQQFNALLQRQTRLTPEIQSAQDLLERTEAEFRRLYWPRSAGDLLDQRQKALNDLKAEQTKINAEIQDFDSSGHDPRGEFVLRCYAMRTGQAFQGMLIYDHGFVKP